MKVAIMGAAVCALALVLTSCDDGNSNPATTFQPGNGKSPELAASCAHPVSFSGIDHCPIGSATLNALPGSLDVTGFSATDGVASDLANATDWSQSGRTNFDAAGNSRIEYRAISGGGVSSSSMIQQIGTSHVYDVWSDFTGGLSMEYTVELSSGGVVVASQSNVDGNARTQIEFSPVLRAEKGQAVATFGEWIQYIELFKVYGGLTAHPGACSFGLSAPSGTTFPSVRLPNGNSYTGIDKVEMIETTSPGHYPYHDFQRIDVLGTIASLSVSSESAH